ncbi:hypothetical protein [Fodinicola acaciae]|uniref:hypothetical protein n=1 Tax=Fodinicola acaciae TaxID=2681555 RepID=UPI0013D6B432|nr:hypothetical protein [Fodinicola acaciae]
MIDQRSAHRRLKLGGLAGIGMLGMLLSGTFAALAPSGVGIAFIIGFAVCALGTLTLVVLSFLPADR